MSKPITATELRSNIYNVLDEVLKTGVPVEVKRGDRLLLITPVRARKRDLKNLPQRSIITCTPDELVATSWEDYWKPGW